MGSSQADQGLPQFHALVWKRLGEPGQSRRLQKKNVLDQNVNKLINLKAQLLQEQDQYLSQNFFPVYPRRVTWENRFLLLNLNKDNLMKVSRTCPTTLCSSKLTVLTCGPALMK